MGDPAVRRFVCRACGWIHLTWSPRCSSCLSLRGLEARTGADAPIAPPAAPPPEVVAEQLAPIVSIVPVEAPRPRLTIARLPPDPELTDPEEELVDMADSAPRPIDAIPETSFVRDSTGLPPLDHVLGGGLVVGSVVLLASPPGIGKTSLSLQMLFGLRHRCLYVTGEETCEQIAATARRIGAISNRLYVIAEQNIAKIFAHARTMRAQTIVIDSIQKMICEDVGGRAGSPGQIKESTARLVKWAKDTGTAIWIIGHVSRDSDISGPKTLEHDVDVVLELSSGAAADDPWTQLKRLAAEQSDLTLAEAVAVVEGSSGETGSGSERILRCSSKNRFGPTDKTGHFKLTATGFVPVDADGWNEEL